MARTLDSTDLRLLEALRDSPRASHAELARLVDIARGTVYSRLGRLEAEGVIASYVPTLDAVHAGFGVLAFTTLEINQGSHDQTTEALSEIVEIVEIHTVTGPGDLLCRILARSNDHLHDVLQQVTAVPTVSRCQSHLALSSSLSKPVIDVLLAGCR